MSPWHVVCRDCTYEELAAGRTIAVRKKHRHTDDEPTHTVEYEAIA